MALYSCSPISVRGELQQLYFRNTVHVVFSRQNPRGNRGRVQRTHNLGRTSKYLRVKICISDVKNKNLEAGANADARAEKF